MPFYNWKAIDLDGNIHQGQLYARSEEFVENFLLQNDLGLMSISQSIFRNLQHRINKKEKNQFIEKLHSLISSGVRIHKALEIIERQTKSKGLKLLITDLLNGINNGLALHEIIKLHKNTFDKITIASIEAGSRSGNLSNNLEGLIRYYKIKDKFLSTVKQALITPIFSLCFFSFISLIIFIFVIPRFKHIFNSLNTSLPKSTALLIAMSDYLISFKFLWLLLPTVLLIILYKILKRRYPLKQYWDNIFLKIPKLNALLYELEVTRFFLSMTLLSESRINLLNSIDIAGNAVSNEKIKLEIAKVKSKTETGNPFSKSLAEIKFDIEEAVEIINVAEHTADITDALSKSAQIYREKVLQKIEFLTTIVQPLFLILIGMLIAFMIISIYMPIFTLSQIVSV